MYIYNLQRITKSALSFFSFYKGLWVFLSRSCYFLYPFFIDALIIHVLDNLSSDNSHLRKIKIYQFLAPPSSLNMPS